MVIDLQKCVGCSACSIGCKMENNIPDGIFWSHYKQETEGTFPNVKLRYISTLCNHCTDAPCVKACPTSPKSTYKAENGMTLYNSDTCISCRACEFSCPYGQITFNAVDAEAKPYHNPDRALTEKGGTQGLRKKGKVEKCTFCDHRVRNGVDPFCVETCPANARIFGDLDDPNSEVSQLVAKNANFVLKPEANTKPNVFYINSYGKK